MADEKIDQKRPLDAQNEHKPVQQRHVDDSFPASDPPAWTTSASKSVAAGCEPDELNEAPVPPGQGLDEHSSTTFRSTAEQAADKARDLYQRGRTYLEQGGHYMPEAVRHYRRGAEAVGRPVQEHPVAALLVIGALGCAVGWMLGRRTSGGSQARLWHAGSNRRPRDTQAWHRAPRSAYGESRFPVRDDVDAASHTNNSF